MKFVMTIFFLEIDFLQFSKDLQYSMSYAPINVMPQGGRPGVPSGFARNFLPQVGIFTILQSPRVGTFDKS